MCPFLLLETFIIFLNYFCVFYLGLSTAMEKMKKKEVTVITTSTFIKECDVYQKILKLIVSYLTSGKKVFPCFCDRTVYFPIQFSYCYGCVRTITSPFSFDSLFLFHQFIDDKIVFSLTNYFYVYNRWNSSSAAKAAVA